MGMTDFEIAGRYTSGVSDILNNLHVGAKVAWLGQKHPEANEDNFIYNSIMSAVTVELDHYFYDLNNPTEGSDSFVWDVHSQWDIEGYDLVLGLRVLYLCDSRTKMIQNLKTCVSNNRDCIFDFMTGNPKQVLEKEHFHKTNKSNTILPFFPEYYDGEFGVIQNHDDQVVMLDHFSEEGLVLNNILTFRDSIKRRFYTLARIDSES